MFRMRHMLRNTRQAREEGPLSPEPEQMPAPTEAPTAAPTEHLMPVAAPTPAPPPPATRENNEPLLPPVDQEETAATPTAEQTQERIPTAETNVPPPQTEEAEIATAEQAPAPVAEVSGQETYHLLVDAAAHVFAQAEKQELLDSEQLVTILKQVLRSFVQGDQLLTEAIRQRTANTPRAQRVANTVLLSIRLGLEIEYNESSSLALGLCTLMHDIGMLTIPDEVLDSPKLTPQQLDMLRNHPLKSQEMVQHFGEKYAWIGEVVVQVHERHDGSGYPSGAKGDDIHEFARIIGLADMYEALGHPRSDRKAHVIYSALTTIIDTRNKHFDPRLIKALINIVSIFPLGSLVKLNNNQIGRVVGANKLYPTRPLIEVLLDHRGKPNKNSMLVHLEEEPMLYIVDPAIDESVLEKK